MHSPARSFVPSPCRGAAFPLGARYFRRHSVIIGSCRSHHHHDDLERERLPAPAGDNINWSDPNNWAPVSSRKIRMTLFGLTFALPAGASVTYDAEKSIPGPSILGQSQINNFSMATGSILTVTTSNSSVIPGLTVNGTANIDNGRLVINSGATVRIPAPHIPRRAFVRGRLPARSDFNLFTAAAAARCWTCRRSSRSMPATAG